MRSEVDVSAVPGQVGRLGAWGPGRHPDHRHENRDERDDHVVEEGHPGEGPKKEAVHRNVYKHAGHRRRGGGAWDLLSAKFAYLSVLFEPFERLHCVFAASTLSFGKLRKGVLLFLVLLGDFLLDSLLGSLFGLFRMNNQPPLLHTFVFGATFLPVVSFCERPHGLNLHLLNPCFCI